MNQFNWLLYYLPLQPCHHGVHFIFSAITSICHILKRSLVSTSRVGGKITEDVSTTQISWIRLQINWWDNLSLCFLELKKKNIFTGWRNIFFKLGICLCLIGRGSEWCSGDYEDRKGLSWTQTEGCSGGTEHWVQVCVHEPVMWHSVPVDCIMFL